MVVFNSLSILAIAESSSGQIEVFSPNYPDAYIVVEATKSRSSDMLNFIQATVYVEEIYEMGDDGTLFVSDSRLLSQEDVEAIGIENFENIADVSASLLSSPGVEVTSPAVRGKLTLSLSASSVYINSDWDYEFYIHAEAGWSSSAWIGTNYPASGSDFISLAWSGGYSCFDEDISIVGERSLPHYCTLHDGVANAARAWEFPERWGIIVGDDYAKNITLSATFVKPQAAGYETYDELIVKYIHTYEDTIGSLTFALAEDVAPTVTLQNVEKQWSIVCILSRIAP